MKMDRLCVAVVLVGLGCATNQGPADGAGDKSVSIDKRCSWNYGVATLQAAAHYLCARGIAPPLPPVLAYEKAGDRDLTLHGGEWSQYTESALRNQIREAYESDPNNNYNVQPLESNSISRLNPNKQYTDRFFWVDAPAAGHWARWEVDPHSRDRGEVFAIFAHVPPRVSESTQNSSVRYRIYNSTGDDEPDEHVIDQNVYGNAQVTWCGEDYSLPGWHLLGYAPLYEGAHVTLDANHGDGVTMVDMVVAVRFPDSSGCE